MPNEISKKVKIGLTGFAARAAMQHKASPAEDEVIMANNRIALLLDNSGSMSSSGGTKSKIELLKDAVQAFVNACDFGDTAVAMYPIPVDKKEVKLTNQGALIVLASLALDASGGTPIGHTMLSALTHEPLTRAVLISDGEATDDPFPAARLYQSAEVPVDCIHIGHDTGGEETLIKIAEMTGGKYLKFTDVNKFVGACKYLTPKYRALLAEPGVAKALGADEIR